MCNLKVPLVQLEAMSCVLRLAAREQRLTPLPTPSFQSDKVFPSLLPQAKQPQLQSFFYNHWEEFAANQKYTQHIWKEKQQLRLTNPSKQTAVRHVVMSHTPPRHKTPALRPPLRRSRGPCRARWDEASLKHRSGRSPSGAAAGSGDARAHSPRPAPRSPGRPRRRQLRHSARGLCPGPPAPQERRGKGRARSGHREAPPSSLP